MNARLLKLAVFFGAFGITLTILLTVVYYVHLFFLQGASIEAIRYDALIYSTVVALFTLSLGLGTTALVLYKERASFWLMLFSTVTLVLGYIFPCERLWKLNYINALSETVIIAIFHLGLLVSSTILLKKSVKCGSKPILKAFSSIFLFSMFFKKLVSFQILNKMRIRIKN